MVPSSLTQRQSKHQPVLLRVLYGTVTVTVMRSGVPGDHFVMYTGLDGGIAARRVTAWLDVRGVGAERSRRGFTRSPS